MHRDTNPQHWKLLFFYYNPQEKRLFVPRRIGLKFTLNFAKPLAWAITGVIVATLAAFAIHNN